MSPSSPSLRDIAKKASLGLSTVSLALRDSPKISVATKEKVRRIAAEMGYREDPLVSAYQARVRSRRPTRYQATIAWIDDYPDPSRWAGEPLLRAANARAESLGYTLDVVRLNGITPDQPGETARRFQRILRGRGIHAVIFPQLYGAPLVAEEWPEFAVVLLGKELGALRVTRTTRRRETSFHEVSPDVPTNVALALRTLQTRGCRRIGLAISDWHDIMNERLCSAAYLAGTCNERELARIPPLLIRDPFAPAAKAQFGAWVRRHRPDAVLVSNLEALDWCRALDIAVPEQLELAHVELSVCDTMFSGIDPRVDLLASSAVDLVTAHLQRNERGTPPFRKRLLIAGVWRDAETTNPAPASSGEE